MVKIFDYQSIGPLLFYLVSMVVYICVFEMFDESSISFWRQACYFYDVVRHTFGIKLFCFGYLVYAAIILSSFITPCRKIGGGFSILGSWVFSAWSVVGVSSVSISYRFWVGACGICKVG